MPPPALPALRSPLDCLDSPLDSPLVSGRAPLAPLMPLPGRRTGLPGTIVFTIATPRGLPARAARSAACC
jgi:hypothetical protein